MPCNYPALGRRAPNGALTYYGHIQAKKLGPPPPNYKDIPLPCGRCWGCRLERSRQWAIRLVHEAQLHSRTSFVTLTYNDEWLPGSRSARRLATSSPAAPSLGLPHRIGNDAHAETHAHEDQDRQPTLRRQDLKAFTHRLNSDVRRRFGKGVKYYACGEYGDQKHRPHYHIAIYGEDFCDDRQFWKRAKSGHILWRSSRLARLWPYGDADIGDLTFESAAYIARYIMKKMLGNKAHDHYRRVDREGNEYWLEPEFSVMSRRPGIAREWFMKHKNDVFPHDEVIARGHPSKPPRYYDKLLEMLAPYEHELMKKAREEAPHNEEDQHPARLDARETVLRAKLKQTKRSLE